MSKKDIEKAQKDAEAHADEDKAKREAIDARNQLENAIYQAKKLPDEHKDKISDDDKKVITEAAEKAEAVLKDDSADKGALEAAAKELSDTIMPIGAKLYQAQAEEGKTEESDDKKSDDKDEPAEGEVVDEK